jgi:hypothetical protein
MQIELSKSLLGLMAPQEIIDKFELVRVTEQSECILLEFDELATSIPIELENKLFTHEGFCNKLEMHTFPQKGKKCYLQIRRRKWKETSTGKIYSNQYDLHKDGMKATDDLGVFIKKNNR